MRYDFIVIGAGIAGVATAELLQRSGRSVLLLEEKDKIGSLSTAQQQGWFHTGALYAALPTNTYFRALVCNIDNLANYYGGFPRMNFRRGQCSDNATSEGWFNNSTNYFIYATPDDQTISWAMKPIWFFAIVRAQARLSWFETRDFTKDIMPQLNNIHWSFDFKRIASDRVFSFDIEKTAKILKSRDCTMNSEIIMSDLTRSFLARGGEILLNTPVAKIEKNLVIDTQGNSYKAEEIILTAGKGIKNLTSLNVKVMKSPLIIVAPALMDVNFVKMHPVRRETVNHIYHKTEYGDYSVIGNAMYFNAQEDVDEERIHEEMLEKTKKILNMAIDKNSTAVYFGYKTELTDKSQLRNYQNHIVPYGTCTVALPGKMALGFSLAVCVCRHFGISPSINIDMGDQCLDQDMISRTLHYDKFLEIISKHRMNA